MKPAGVWTLVLGIVLCCVGAIVGLLALGELGRYTDLRGAGNQFSGVAANSFVYLASSATVGILAGVGLCIVGVSMKAPRGAVTVPVTASGSPINVRVGKRSNGYVWDGSNWVPENEYGVDPASPYANRPE